MTGSQTRGRLTIALVAAIGCGSPPSDEEIQVRQGNLFFQTTTTLWNGATSANLGRLGTGVTIPVCWMVRPRKEARSGAIRCPNQTASTDCEGKTISVTALRDQVRTGIENSWMRYGNIELVGWGNCAIDPATNRHIDANLAGSIAIQFGSSDANLFDDKIDRQGKYTDKASLIQYNWSSLQAGTGNFNLLHEFGHALGFAHEWWRTDWTSGTGTSCNPDPSKPGTFLTKGWDDIDSIMEYCVGNPRFDPAQLVLTPGDIMGLQKTYGRKASGSLVGFRGQCADIQGAVTANGTPVISYPCRGAWNDTFFRDPASTGELFKTSINNKCLNVSGGTAPNPVISWDCGAFENERFTTTNVEWRAMGNMCVAAVPNPTGTGKHLEARKCDGSASQKWDFFHPVGGLRNDQIRKNGTNECVAANTTTGALGQDLILTTCSSSSTRQRFDFPGLGRIVLRNNTGLCANVSGGIPTPNSHIILWDGCGDPPFQNSQFTINGRIRALNNCMTTQGDGGAFNAIRAEACTGNTTTQLWEYYL